MKKDYLRDYCTEAFRFYARSGGRSAFIKSIENDIIRSKGSGVSKPTEAALIRQEQIIAEHASELADIDAVSKVLVYLDICRHRDIIQAIEIVYYTDCWKDLEKGDISARVHKAELTIPASTNTIYRWLRQARDMFAKERGLRIRYKHDSSTT